MDAYTFRPGTSTVPRAQILGLLDELILRKAESEYSRRIEKDETGIYEYIRSATRGYGGGGEGGDGASREPSRAVAKPAAAGAPSQDSSIAKTGTKTGTGTGTGTGNKTGNKTGTKTTKNGVDTTTKNAYRLPLPWSLKGSHRKKVV